MSDAVVNGLAGAGGGIVAQILTYPLQAVSAGSLSFCVTFYGRNKLDGF